MAKVELKQPIVAKIQEEVKDAESVVLVDYRGISVADDTKLRKELRESGVVYRVYKNTMMKRAFEGTDFAQLDPHLDGPSAVAISKEDATAPARILAKYAKDGSALEFKAGVVEGTLYDDKGLVELSKVPTKDELLSKLLGSIKSPISNLARVLSQIAENGGATEAKEEVKAEEPATEEPKAEEPVAEEAKAEEPAVEEAKAEEPAAE
ncbi:MAG: 50S ribosomal protein L10 [Lachnospiraceae bacterium]|jgi:large subunit ribosomal protein L10|nr:50S ribosomal protein L10 [Lachnospiraceae bacterium]